MKARSSKKNLVRRKGRVEVAEAHRLVQQQLKKADNPEDPGSCGECLDEEFQMAEASTRAPKKGKIK